MALPQITSSDVEALIPNCKVVGNSLGGGQKLVFPCSVGGTLYAIKFILLNNLTDDFDGTIASKVETVRARVEREIKIMQKIDSPFIAKMGAVNLTAATLSEQNILFYSEEWIDGQDLSQILQSSNKLTPAEVVKLGTNIVKAISELWNLNKVHRDIKPQNITRRACDGSYVLLDLGLALDLDDKSLTQFGFVPGTKVYFSPEQLDVAHKRDIDFRSDLFSLGSVLYQAITGMHPFYTYGMPDQELFLRINSQPIIAPNTVDPNIPKSLSDIICRLLSKQPSGRYRKCLLLLDEFRKTSVELGVES